MKIGILGLGVVGSALKFGFEKLGHEVSFYDPKYKESKFGDILDTEIIYICVPTPLKNFENRCDTTIVRDSVCDLFIKKYNGIIVIKSTVEPGTTEKLIQDYKNDRICFVPEFLRERCAIVDFVEQQNLLAIGTNNSEVYYKVLECHGDFPKKVIKLSPTEAELLKYYHNIFGALRVTFANEFYEVCKKLGANYQKIKNGVIYSSKLPDIYLDVNDNMRGYSSICWNKDIPAFVSLVNGLGLNMKLFETIINENDKFKKTPFEGTRE